MQRPDPIFFSPREGELLAWQASHTCHGIQLLVMNAFSFFCESKCFFVWSESVLLHDNVSKMFLCVAVDVVYLGWQLFRCVSWQVWLSWHCALCSVTAFLLCRERFVYRDSALCFCFQVTFSNCFSPVVRRMCFPSSDFDDQVSKPRQMQLSIPAEEVAAVKRPRLTSCGISLGWTSSR